MCQAFVKLEDRVDPKRIYHMMTISEVQSFFGDVVCALYLLNCENCKAAF